MRSKTSKKYIRVILIVLVFFYIGYQVFQMSYNPIKTTLAQQEVVYDSVTKDAIFIRDEDVIQSSFSGTMVYSVKDGTRVEKGGTIADVFVSDSEASSYNQLNAMDKKIAYYEDILLQNNQGSTSIGVIDTNISTSINNYVRTVNSGWLESAQEQGDEISDNITNRKITIGESIDVNSILNELYTQRSNLKNSITDSEAVKADKAGYFISEVDGNESAVDYSKATELSVSNITNLLKTKKSSNTGNAVGKIIKSFDWYVACNVEKSAITGLEVGDKVSVTFPQSSVEELVATVAAINTDTENAGSVAFILKFDNMDENIASIRSNTVEIRFNKYEGIKIPNEALRAVTVKSDGKEKTVKCVYVLSGNIVKQKFVDVIYTGNDYVIAKSNSVANGYIRLYDKIITKGEDLSDGKVVKYTG